MMCHFAKLKWFLEWAREAVALLVSEGITEGKNGKMLKPEDKMTRAEAAALIRRLLKTTDLID